MERKEFLKTCGYAAMGLPLFGLLQSCGAFYYASATEDEGKISVSKSQFIISPENPGEKRDFVLIDSRHFDFPICLYKTGTDQYVASLLKCTHRGCGLNVGGGIYSCPCHGSEFSIDGNVLQGPANQKLKTFNIKTNRENVVIYLS